MFGERHKGKSEPHGAGAEAIMADMMSRTRATVYLSQEGLSVILVGDRGVTQLVSLCKSQ